VWCRCVTLQDAGGMPSCCHPLLGGNMLQKHYHPLPCIMLYTTARLCIRSMMERMCAISCTWYSTPQATASIVCLSQQGARLYAAVDDMRVHSSESP
jgi:hypothetical protein